MNTGDYNRLDRAVHRLVLGSRVVQRTSFEMECGRPPYSPAETGCPNPVFVSGLARSGTTTLLRILHRTGEFESLTYRDMPFVLMPQLWARVTRKLYKPSVPSERAHGDSILVDFDSPECFESVFWRTFSGDSYAAGGYLRPHEPGPDVMARFRRYISSVAARSPGTFRRYLSKNNNNLLRLAAIRLALPGAGILVLYRDPLQAAASSLRQHLRFCEAQRNDPFILEYMNLLEHHEFGLGHKPFRFAAAPPADPVDPNYWLTYWTDVHEYLLETKTTFTFVSYEKLCASPELALRQLFAELDIAADHVPLARLLQQMPAGSLPVFEERLVRRSRATHDRLFRDSRNLICAN